METTLEVLPISKLAAIYNAAIEENNLTDFAPVKKFADKAAGVKRIQKLVDAHNLTLVDNGEGGVALLSTDKAPDEDAEEITLHTEELVEPKAKKTKAPKKEKGEPKPRGPAPEFANELKISVLVNGNPKKVGTPSHARFETYFAGDTVGDFIKAGGTRADLRWDIKHKFIKIG
jgi:hypothetical protein